MSGHGWPLLVVLGLAGCPGSGATPVAPPTRIAIADAGHEPDPATAAAPSDAGAPGQPSATLDDDLPAADGPWVIAIRDEPYELFVDIHAPGRETPTWHFRPRSRVLFLRFDRDAPLGEQIAPLQAMLLRLEREHGDVLRASRLRLGLDVFGYPTFVERLARYAARDPRWKRILEKPRTPKGGPPPSDLHRYLVTTSNENDLFPELREVLAAVRLSPRLIGVEKCSSASRFDRGELGRFVASLAIVSPDPLPLGCLIADFEIVAPP